MTSTQVLFHFSAGFLLTAISILGTIILILVRENSASAFSLSNMLSAGMYFALGITGNHLVNDPSQSFYFAKNIVIATTFAVMIMRNQVASTKATSTARYARINISEQDEEDGVEMTASSTSSSQRNSHDFALDVPSGISPHFPIILGVFSIFSFLEAFQFAQVDHTGYGSLAEVLMNKVIMSVCFGTAAATESVMSKSLPKMSPIYFISSPLGILIGFLLPAELPYFVERYTYFAINGVCLYVSTCLLLPEELKIKDASLVKIACFVFGFSVVFITEYFLY